MSRSGGVALVWCGLAALVVGLVVGFLPTAAGGVSCGSAFVATTAARETDYLDALQGTTTTRGSTCEDRRALLRIPAVALILVGAGTVFAGWQITAAHNATTRQRSGT